ncbi:MAG: tRNA (adenine-N1)-methyltransferase [Chloroflexi bacterium]|nr:tRNA (adenine-N1)-methyltransferase [Chloroflexota bacterium]
MTDNTAQANQFAMLIAPDDKRYLVRLTPSQLMHTHHGFIPHNDMIGKPFGTFVKTQLGYSYLLFQPSTFDLVTRIKRSSQIIYPKEIGYILLKMNIVPGVRIVEAGTGSGGLTLALSRFVRPNGRIYTYEERDDMMEMARKNLDKVGALDVVEMKQRDIRDGFDERNVDALFLDVREPWLFLAQAHAALKSGGFFGSLVPTTNQLSEILQEMERLGNWADIEVVEILMRHYKPNAERLRPEDRMIAHTGYLLFARAITKHVSVDEPQVVIAEAEQTMVEEEIPAESVNTESEEMHGQE